MNIINTISGLFRSNTPWDHSPNREKIEQVRNFYRKYRSEIERVELRDKWLTKTTILNHIMSDMVKSSSKEEKAKMQKVLDFVTKDPKWSVYELCTTLALFFYEDSAYLLECDVNEIKIMSNLGQARAGMFIDYITTRQLILGKNK